MKLKPTRGPVKIGNVWAQHCFNEDDCESVWIIWATVGEYLVLHADGEVARREISVTHTGEKEKT